MKSEKFDDQIGKFDEKKHDFLNRTQKTGPFMGAVPCDFGFLVARELLGPLLAVSNVDFWAQNEPETVPIWGLHSR